MPTWYLIAQGPALRFTLVFLALALARLALLAAWRISGAIRRAGDRRIPYGPLLRQTAGWMLPLGHLHRIRRAYSYASFGFHLGILGAGLFLANHIDLIYTQTGLAWPALNKPLLDGLALLTILTGSFLLLHRLYVSASRALSSLSDYLLLVVILNIFVSGFLAGQAWNPLPYNGLMLFHTLNGIALLLVIPFTKIAHCILYPLIRLGSEVAWHFPARAGQQVVETLYGPKGRQL